MKFIIGIFIIIEILVIDKSHFKSNGKLLPGVKKEGAKSIIR